LILWQGLDPKPLALPLGGKRTQPHELRLTKFNAVGATRLAQRRVPVGGGVIAANNVGISPRKIQIISAILTHIAFVAEQ